MKPQRILLMKKRLLFLLPFLHICLQASTFDFVENKKNGALDKQFIKKIVETFSCDLFFETGTYDCATTINVASEFKQVYTVELFDELYQRANAKLAPHKNVRVYHGKSPDVIRIVGPSLLNNNVLFWLDAHYSGPGTALSNPNESDPAAVTAIRDELEAIREVGMKNCVILIDDIRGFGTEIKGQEYLGCWAYPTLQEVKNALLKINSHFEIALLGDMLLAYDATKYEPHFSETVLACTSTRLYNGYNLTDEELALIEKNIISAPAHEKAFIKSLYHQMTECKDPMFWHDLWYGLTELGNNNLKIAHKAISKVPLRLQHLDKNRVIDNKHISCSHPLIDVYLASCKS